jgi:hypothetical protein
MINLGRFAVALVAAGGLTFTPTIANASTQDAYGCNYYSCISVQGNASGYTVSGTPVGQGGVEYGHFHIWGPNVDYNGPNQEWAPGLFTPALHGWGSGQTCAEFWRYYNGQYYSVGLACEQVS